MKRIFVLLIISSSLIAMDRPTAMGQPVTAGQNGSLLRTCANCCSSECCPMASIVACAEVYLCGCLITPSMSDRCSATQGTRIALAGAGAALLGVLGGTTYIKNVTKKNRN